jgi:hypothetical protein
MAFGTLEAGGTFFSYLYGQTGMDFFSWMWAIGPQHPMRNLVGRMGPHYCACFIFWREKEIFAMTSAVRLLLRAAVRIPVRIPVGTWPEAVFLL